MRRGAVGADDTGIDHCMLHQMAADIVGDHRMRHAVLAELEGGQRGALVARPGLVDPDMDRDAGIVRGVDRRGGGAPIDGRQPTGVAMGENIDRRAALGRRELGDESGAVAADGAADLDIVVADRRRVGIGGGPSFAVGQGRENAAHFVERPAQIDRRGAGFQ